MKNSRRSLATVMLPAVLAVASALPGAATALASDVTGRDVAVGYADLDAGTVDGATRLLQRIEVAAGRVCAPLDHGDLASRTRRQACEQKLTADAVTRVNTPALVAVYQSARRDAPRVIARAN